VEIFEPTSSRGSDKVKVKVTLLLAVYRQFVLLGAKPLEDPEKGFADWCAPWKISNDAKNLLLRALQF
jgi:hypothetical protein